MRVLAPLLLAGLAAVTFAAMPASALCADDGNGGCTAPVHDVALVVKACADDASRACIVPAEDVDAVFLWSGRNNVTLDNRLGTGLDLEALVIARLDDAESSDGSAGRLRADPIGSFAVPAGQSATHELLVDGNASKVRLQALLADGREAELDLDVQHVMTMMGGVEGQPGDQPVDPEAEELADDSAPVVDSDRAANQDAPYLGVVAVVGVLAAIVGLRRFD